MNLLFETKYALRRLKNSPGYSLLSLLVVSLSIALSVIIFALIVNFTLRPLGFPQLERWQAVRGFEPGGWRGGFSDGLIYKSIEQANPKSIEQLGAMEDRSVLLDDGETTFSLAARFITPNVLQDSSEKPLLGRLLQPSDAGYGSPQVVLLSYSAWRNYYDSDPGIVGTRTLIDGQTRTIAGVLRKDSKFIHGAFWLPLGGESLSEQILQRRPQTLVKMREGYSNQLVNQELQALNQRMKNQYPDRLSDTAQWRLVPLNSLLFQTNAPIFLSLSLIGPILILLGCLNIGTLLFARIQEQARQLAVRNAVGSSSWQLIKQATLESLFICLTGALLGLAISAIAIVKINAIMDGYWSNHIQGEENPSAFQIDGFIGLFALLEAFMIWLASSLLPALRAVRQDILQTLSSTGKGSTDRHSNRTTTVLVGTQVIAGCFLLILSGTYAYRNVYETYLDRGIETAELATAWIDLGTEYNDQDKRKTYIRDLLVALETVAGTRQISLTSALPDNYSPPVKVFFEDRINPPETELPSHIITHVAKNYFETVNLPLRAGRHFSNSDNDTSTQVVIVDEHFARLYWPNENAVGKRIQIGTGEDRQWLTVIGVSAHVKRQVADNRYTLYRPLQQQVPGDLLLLFRHDKALITMRKDLATAATTVNRNIPLTNILSIEDYQIATWGWRMVQSQIFVWAYCVSLLLIALGIFAVLSKTIVQRIREIGVRRALGSSNQKVLATFIGKGFVFVGIGCAVGSGLAVLVSEWLIDLRSGDFPNFLAHVSIVVISTLAAFIFIASFLPARKAIALEPGEALRYE